MDRWPPLYQGLASHPMSWILVRRPILPGTQQLGTLWIQKISQCTMSRLLLAKYVQGLSEAYIPACVDCQCNKGRTAKPVSPLHSLPVPDQHSNSIAIDFIGPCPWDDGFNCMVTITNWLGEDIQITPTHLDISAECFMAQFFDLWYCKNGLPLILLATVTNYLSVSFGRR